MAGKTPKKSAKVARSSARKPTKTKAATTGGNGPAGPVLLTGGNPQIAKADGDAPVQAYIAALPGWKHDAGQRLDALIVRTAPGVPLHLRAVPDQRRRPVAEP